MTSNVNNNTAGSLDGNSIHFRTNTTTGSVTTIPQLSSSDLVRQPLITTITWIGNGTSQTISLPFQPDGIIVIADGKYPIFSHRFMWRKRAAYVGLAQPHITTGGVQFSTNSITVDSNSSVNSVGVHYTALVFADNGSNTIICGSYSGNGTAGREIDSVSGQPVWVLLKRDNTYTGQLRFDSSPQGLQAANVTPVDNITGFTTKGFTVSSAADVNAAVTAAGTGGEAYDFLAFLPSPCWTTFTYAASGTSGQKLTLPWTACASFIKSTDSSSPQHMAMMVNGNTKNSDSGSFVSDGIVSISSTGITLGTNQIVNAATKIYNGIAFTSNTASTPFIQTPSVFSGLQVTSASSSGVVCQTTNTGFDRVSAPFSLEFYGNINQLLATDQYLFTRSLNSSNITYGMYWNATNQQFEFVGHESGGNKALFSTATQLSGPLHIIMTFDGTSKFRFAINGRVVKVMDTSFTLDTVANSLMTFGCRANSGAPASTGCASGTIMYLARFYSSVLSDTQILSRYKRCALKDTSVTDVSFYEEWDFSRVVGSTVYAAKSTTNNGTITACAVV